MTKDDSSTTLFDQALPGAWIADKYHLWQMNFLDASKLANFSRDRGLSNFDKNDITQLWQLGLIKADLITSTYNFNHTGLVDRGIDSNGCYIYSDERLLNQLQDGWGNALKTLEPLQEGVELLFHPFRYYVLSKIDLMLKGMTISPMMMFNQDSYARLLNIRLNTFNQGTSSDNFIANVYRWNDVSTLAIITEPYIYERIFHSVEIPTIYESEIDSLIQIRQEIAEYWTQNVQALYQSIGQDRLEEIRQEICVATQMLDSNRWVHTLLCLGDSNLRIETEGNLGGALLLRTMAEMTRRATENVFDTSLREEDELGFGWVPEGVKETIYGSNRLLDDKQAGGQFARRHDLDYRPRIRLYGEGNTEYGVLNSFFKSMGLSVVNLHGLIKEGKSMVTFFRDCLRDDIKNQRYSLVVIDGDVHENVKILESAARNNGTSPEDGLFGGFFLSKPDFEIANFEIEELEEVLWRWVGEEGTSQANRELLHNQVKKAQTSTEFFKGVKSASKSLLQLVGYTKGEKWGEELMKFAWEYPLKQGRKRQIIEVVELALRWEKTTSLERYETAKKTYMVNPQTGEIVKRTTFSFSSDT